MHDDEELIGLDDLADSSSIASKQQTVESFEVGESDVSAAELEVINRNRSIRYYLLCILMGSLMTASSKLAMKDTDQYIVMFSRMLGTFLISMLWMVYKRTDHLFWGPPGLRMLLVARGSVGTLSLALTYYAVQYMPLPDYSVITFLAPLLTAVAARMILGEPYHWIQAVASCISFTGVVIITRPSFLFGNHIELPEGVTLRQHTTAVFCVLLTVLCTTTIFLLLRTIGTRISAHTVVAQYALQTLLLSSIVLTVKKLYWHQSVRFPTEWRTWLLLVFIGVVGFTYQFFMNTAIARVRAGILTQFDYIILIYMMLWQFLLFHTLPDLVSIGGGLLIIAGVVCSSRFRTEH